MATFSLLKSRCLMCAMNSEKLHVKSKGFPNTTGRTSKLFWSVKMCILRLDWCADFTETLG